MSEIQSLARGLQILDLFASPGCVWSVTDIATRLGVSKSSASRLARTLAAHGYLAADPNSRGYKLGAKMERPGDSRRGLGLRDVARPFIFPLMKNTGECAHTALASRGHALVIDDVESTASLRVAGGVGRLNMSHCTAVGKCLLAFGALPFPEVLPRRMSQTITEPEDLERHLDIIRQQGFAFDDEENEPGVRCVAAPVYDETGRVVGCIGISGPTVRMTPDRITELADMVMQTAHEITAVLGGGSRGKTLRPAFPSDPPTARSSR